MINPASLTWLPITFCWDSSSEGQSFFGHVSFIESSFNPSLHPELLVLLISATKGRLIYLPCIQKPQVDLLSVLPVIYTISFSQWRLWRHVYIHPTQWLKHHQKIWKTEWSISFSQWRVAQVCFLALDERKLSLCCSELTCDLYSNSSQHVECIMCCFYWQGKPVCLLLL